MDSERIMDLALKALESLPDKIRDRLDNVDLVLEDWPSKEQLSLAGLCIPEELLGLYEGVPLTHRENYGMVLPDKISLFQGPIEMACANDDEIERELRVTLVHEVAHHFGIHDHYLTDMGLA
jgi:predicted Zn-dependent protease with MMP-like domain